MRGSPKIGGSNNQSDTDNAIEFGKNIGKFIMFQADISGIKKPYTNVKMQHIHDIMNRATVHKAMMLQNAQRVSMPLLRKIQKNMITQMYDNILTEYNKTVTRKRTYDEMHTGVLSSRTTYR